MWSPSHRALHLGFESVTNGPVRVEGWEAAAGESPGPEVGDRVTAREGEEPWPLVVEDSQKAAQEKVRLAFFKDLRPSDDFAQRFGMKEGPDVLRNCSEVYRRG